MRIVETILYCLIFDKNYVLKMLVNAVEIQVPAPVWNGNLAYLVWTFPLVTISWIQAVKAYDVSFYSSKIFLDQSKNFWHGSNCKNSVVKSCFQVQSKTIPRQIQNHLGPDEGQSNSCVMYALFFILICSTLIKYDLNQCCVS